MHNSYVRFIGAVLLSFLVMTAAARAEAAFRFETFQTLNEMEIFLAQKFPAGSPRETLRKVFIDEGKGTLKIHPGRPNTEKYIYDVNLCSYYVWRWNISADYDGEGRLIKAYLNGRGDAATEGMDEKAAPGKKAAIYKMKRQRPEAHKGENTLAYILLDKDSDPSTTEDRKLIGGGPNRADPVNLGQMIMYTNVDPWRSIFDSDEASHIAPYPGDCTAVDAFIEKTKKERRGTSPATPLR